MEFVLSYLEAFWAVFTAIAPWLLVGFFLAGLVATFVSPDKIKKHLGENSKNGVLKAVLWGVPLPICSCGIIPIATALRKSGARRGAVGAFYIATPQTGVDSILVTWLMMGWVMAIIRPILAAVTGITGGVLIDKFTTEKVAQVEEKKSCCCSCSCSSKKEEEAKPSSCCSSENASAIPVDFIGKFRYAMAYGFGKMVKSISKSLLWGVAIAALIQCLIPNNFSAEYIGGNIVLEFVLVTALAIPLYVCSSASVPIAVSLMLKGFSPGAALLFLILGPTTNAISIAAMKNILGSKATVISLATITFFAVVAGVIINCFDIPLNLAQIGEACSANEHIIANGCGLALGMLLLQVNFCKFLKR